MTSPARIKPWAVAKGLLISLILCTPQACKQNKADSGAKNPAPPAQGAANGAGTGGAKTCLNIVDGQTTTAYPATYLTVSLVNRAARKATFCTGTFVSDNTMITAAHCMPNTGPSNFLLLTNGATFAPSDAMFDTGLKAVAIFVDSSAKPGSEGLLNFTDGTVPMGKDIAVVVFPDHTAASYSPLSTATMPAGTAVSVVGYGITDTNPNAASNGPLTKRVGVNSLTAPDQRFPYDGLYQTHAWAHPGGAAAHGQKTSSAAPGDSGGPLFAGNTMIGIVKYGYTTQEVPNLVQMIGTDALNFYVDVTNSTAQGVFARAKAAGARFAPVAATPAPTIAAGTSAGTVANAAGTGVPVGPVSCLN